MGVVRVYCADWLTCEVPYYGDANAYRVPICSMSTLVIPAASLVYVAVFTHNKVVADVVPTIRVHVKVLVGTDYVSALGLGRAECGGAPVMNCGDGHPRRQSGGCASRGSRIPPCSADNTRACC